MDNKNNKRKKIPSSVKEDIKFRQRNRCACCMDFGKEFHHVVPVSLGGDNKHNNIVLLCEQHHNLYHLGDIDIINQVLEYVYYLNNKCLPSDIE